MRKHKQTKEEKFSEVVSNHISDLRFDLEFAGRYLAWALPNLAYNRLLVVLEAMKYERENKNDTYDI